MMEMKKALGKLTRRLITSRIYRIHGSVMKGKAKTVDEVGEGSFFRTAILYQHSSDSDEVLY